MHTVAIQIASQSDAAESIAKLVEEWALDSATVHAVNFHPGTSDDWYFWNITFAVEDIRRFVRLFRPLEQYCTRRLAEIARRSKQRMQRFPHSPEQHASIVVVAAETEAEKPQWDDYMEIFNYSTESATLE